MRMKNRLSRFDKLFGQDHGKRWRIILTSILAVAATGILLEGLLREPVNFSVAVATTLGLIVFGLQVWVYTNKSE